MNLMDFAPPGVLKVSSTAHSAARYSLNPKASHLHISTSKKPSSDTPPPILAGLHSPSYALPKGKACLECRRRKVRCDAQTPCQGCTRMHKDCIYEEEHERVQRLMGKVAELEERLRALIAEKIREGGNSSDSYQTPEALGKEYHASDVTDLAHTYAPSSSSSIGASLRRTKDEPDLSGDWWHGDPPPDIQLYLVKLFFERSRSGFRTHQARFIKSLSLPSKSQPHPGLLYIIYLIACHLSENVLLKRLEPAFLARARFYLAQSLGKRDRLVHFLAGSVLLAYYLLISGRFLEAAHEAALAARFAIACNLHKITCPIWRPSSIKREDTFSHQIHAGVFNAPLLPPPIDSIDLGERINLFWTILLLDHSGSLVTGLPPNIPYEDIETVWPLTLEEFEHSLVTEDKDSSVQSLFDPPRDISPTFDVQDSLQTRNTKSIVLLVRVSRFAAYGAACTPVQRNTPEFRAEFRTYFDAITRFGESLPPLHLPPARAAVLASSPDSASSSTGIELQEPPKPDPLFLVHTYVHVSYIHIYNAVGDQDEDREQKSRLYRIRLAAAQKAVRDIRALDAYGSDFQKLPMMLGFAWSSVAHVHAQHILKLKSEHEVVGLEKGLSDFYAITAAIRVMCTPFPILEFQFEKLKQYGLDLHPP